MGIIRKSGGVLTERESGGFRRLLLFLFRMFIIVALSFVLLSTVSYFTIRHFIVVGEMPVPNVVGLTSTQALREISRKKFSMKFDRYEFSKVIAEGRIVSQYPAGGVRAKIGSPVRVVISSGSPLVSVPDVRGDTEIGAGIKLRAADLKVGAIAREHHPRIKRDAVIAQEPPPRTGAPRNYHVKLLVSLGLKPPESLMPSLASLTLTEAREKLDRMGFEISEVKKAHTPQPRNRVIAQMPPAGALLRKGCKIIITVSSGLGAYK